MSAAVSTCEAPRVPAPLNSWTVSPATASEPVAGSVTLTVRSVSLVLAPLVSVPVTGATSSVTEVMVGAVGAVAGDGDDDGGVDAIREGDRAGAAIVEAADREGDGGRLRIVDDVVGGVGDREGRDLGLVGIQGDRIAGGGGGVALAVGEAQRGGDGAVVERMQVGAVGAVAGDGDDDGGVDAIREGDRAGAAIVEAADREGDGGRLRIVDDVVGGVGDREGRDLGPVGIQGDRIAGGGGGVALAVGEAQRGGDGAVVERMQVGAVGAVAGDGDDD